MAIAVEFFLVGLAFLALVLTGAPEAQGARSVRPVAVREHTRAAHTGAVSLGVASPAPADSCVFHSVLIRKQDEVIGLQDKFIKLLKN